MRMEKRYTTVWLCVTALLTAMNVIMSSFGVPVPGGHLYLNDVIICTAALLLDPLASFIVGGIGAFLGDFFFYPAPMFVSLVTHGLQAVVISLVARRFARGGKGGQRAVALQFPDRGHRGRRHEPHGEHPRRGPLPGGDR